MFSGVYTALITPFANGHIDKKSLEAIIEQQIEAQVAGIVPCGTTGESPTLSPDEQLEVIALSVKQAKGRIQVIAGTGSNNTQKAIYMTQEAAKLGVDGSLQVCPYYNKPSQEGLYAHYKAISQATDLPIMLYSIPGRSVIEISIETIARLATDCPTIVANKEAGGNPHRVSEIANVVPSHFDILCGDDILALEFIERGASGLVSVASNIIPLPLQKIIKLALNNQWEEARKKQAFIQELLVGLMTLDTNPVPIKIAASILHLCSPELRLPLVTLSPQKKEALTSLLKKSNLLSL